MPGGGSVRGVQAPALPPAGARYDVVASHLNACR